MGFFQFSSKEVEAEYAADRALAFARLDRAVAVPWTLFWLSLIKRVWGTVPLLTMAQSFCCLLVTISPSYLQAFLGVRRYSQLRVRFIVLARLGYILHPGGGLYRDGLMSTSIANTALGAANLFVWLTMGSRTFFWLILAFGYQLPPLLRLPLDALQLGMLMWSKPSTPFCSVMQTPASQPLFETIANGLPLVSIVPLGRPKLVEGADICNPLIIWIQIGLGYLLPLLASVCTEIEARRQFAARRQGRLPPADAAHWGPSCAASHYNPWAIMAIAYPHLLTALWYLLMWGQMLFPTAEQVAAAQAAARAAGMAC